MTGQNSSRLLRSQPPHLRFGLFLKLMSAFAAVVLIVGVLVTWLTARATREEFFLFTNAVSQRQAERIAPLLGAYYEAYGSWEAVDEVLTFRDNRAGTRGMMAPMTPGMDGTHGGTDMWQLMGTQVLVADSDGKIVAGSADELVGVSLSEQDLAAGSPVWADGVQVGTVLVTVGALSGTYGDEFLAQVNQATLLAALAAVLAALLLGGLITWGITRPVRALTLAAEAVAAGDLSQRVSVKGDDEVGELGEAFNHMAAALERGEQLRRQMTADIAHELRTPLSVIQGNVEALQDGVFPLTVAALEPIQAKTELLSRLVEDLRKLALAEAGQLPLDRQPTDLAALAQRTATAFQPGAEARSIKLQVQSEDDLPAVDADPQRVEQVLVNLLSNALRHTPDGGLVTVRVQADGRQVTTWVSDTGPGIPAQDLPNVFERFFRVDRGRARDADGDGTGLGLAVARSIVQAHGGEIGVSSPPGQGATFWFSLPAV